MNMENKITNDLIEQAKKAGSVDALLALAKENGISMTEEAAEKLFTEWHTTKELSDDELDSVAGGCGFDDTCPKCGGTLEFDHVRYGFGDDVMVYKCNKCRYTVTD